jgi:hypothetical protein
VLLFLPAGARGVPNCYTAISLLAKCSRPVVSAAWWCAKKPACSPIHPPTGPRHAPHGHTAWGVAATPGMIPSNRARNGAGTVLRTGLYEHAPHVICVPRVVLRTNANALCSAQAAINSTVLRIGSGTVLCTGSGTCSACHVRTLSINACWYHRTDLLRCTHTPCAAMCTLPPLSGPCGPTWRAARGPGRCPAGYPTCQGCCCSCWHCGSGGRNVRACWCSRCCCCCSAA